MLWPIDHAIPSTLIQAAGMWKYSTRVVSSSTGTSGARSRANVVQAAIQSSRVVRAITSILPQAIVEQQAHAQQGEQVTREQAQLERDGDAAPLRARRAHRRRQ